MTRQMIQISNTIAAMIPAAAIGASLASLGTIISGGPAPCRAISSSGAVNHDHAHSAMYSAESVPPNSIHQSASMVIDSKKDTIPATGMTIARRPSAEVKSPPLLRLVFGPVECISHQTCAAQRRRSISRAALQSRLLPMRREISSITSIGVDHSQVSREASLQPPLSGSIIEQA